MESPSQCAAVIHLPPGIAEAPRKLPLEERNPEEDDEFNNLEHRDLYDFDADIILREIQEEEEIQKKEGRRVPRRGGGTISVVDIAYFDDVRTELIEFSKLALEKYNAKGDEEMFVFHELVKSTQRIYPGGLYFITFLAKKAGGGGEGGDAAILTFLAKVWRRTNSTPWVMSCFLKPT